MLIEFLFCIWSLLPIVIHNRLMTTMYRQSILFISNIIFFRRVLFRSIVELHREQTCDMHIDCDIRYLC